MTGGIPTSVWPHIWWLLATHLVGYQQQLATYRTSGKPWTGHTSGDIPSIYFGHIPGGILATVWPRNGWHTSHSSRLATSATSWPHTAGGWLPATVRSLIWWRNSHSFTPQFGQPQGWPHLPQSGHTPGCIPATVWQLTCGIPDVGGLPS